MYFLVLLILFVVLVYCSFLHDNAHGILYPCWVANLTFVYREIR